MRPQQYHLKVQNEDVYIDDVYDYQTVIGTLLETSSRHHCTVTNELGIVIAEGSAEECLAIL